MHAVVTGGKLKKHTSPKRRDVQEKMNDDV